MKSTLITSLLLGAAFAINLQSQSMTQATAEVLQPAPEEETDGGDCCCTYVPCLPTCKPHCPKPKEMPPALRDVELNLDILLTEILHEE